MTTRCVHIVKQKNEREREKKGIAKIHDEKKRKLFFLDKCFELSCLCMKFLMRK